MKKPNHTPLPWIAKQVGSVQAWRITDASENSPAACRAYSSEDATYIVKAANSYPKLVAALRMAYDGWDGIVKGQNRAHEPLTRYEQECYEAAKEALREIGEEV